MKSGIIKKYKSEIFKTPLPDFNAQALKIFEFQSEYCQIYKEFLNYLKIKPEKIKKISQIPFLPVEVFKNHKVITNECGNDDLLFLSSGTSGTVRSKHFVSDPNVYRQSILKGFERFYGFPDDYIFLALLPSYLENKNASLIWMVQCLMDAGRNKNNRFYGKNIHDLYIDIQKLLNTDKKIFLIGVSFALLEFVEKFPLDLSGHIIMETGGMKGQGRELTRIELHEKLCSAFKVNTIHSEYGMTELLSQAYAPENGRFITPPWMKILLRDPLDPFDVMESGHNGGINIIDLANICSCSFLSSMDMGNLYQDGSFEVSGRFDNSDVRGCNLMYNA